MGAPVSIELIKKVREVGKWFKEYGVHFNAVENLKDVRVGGQRPFITLTAKQFSRWFHMGEQPLATQWTPQDGTKDWILALHACKSRPFEHLEVLDKLGFNKRFQQEIIGGILPTNGHVEQNPQAPSSPQDWCDGAARQARQGYPVPALSHLKETFRDYASRGDLESALAIVPTLIYIIGRHFTIQTLGKIAIDIRGTLAGRKMSSYDPLIRRLAAVQVGEILTEHGEGKRAKEIFEEAGAELLVADKTSLPWSKSQIMRSMAAHAAIHDPHPENAEYWLRRAEEDKNPNNQRGIAAMRFTVAMKVEDFGTAWDKMRKYYEESRTILLSGAKSGSLLKVCNDVFLGMQARQLSGTKYTPADQLEDIRALRRGLAVFGRNKPQMEDTLMRYPVHRLFAELQSERVGLLRTAFDDDRKTLEDVVSVVDVLLDRRSD